MVEAAIMHGHLGMTESQKSTGHDPVIRASFQKGRG